VNWKLLAPLALLGPLMGALVVLGVFPEGSDRFGWLVVVGVCALRCARREPERAVLHGGVVGFWNGASATLLQALFFETTIRNNPYFVAKFANQPEGFDLRFFMFQLAPFIGVAGGALTALLALLAARVMRARKETSP